jgi:methyl-accepting chemotaxis protein
VDAIRYIAARMNEIDTNTMALAAAVEQQNAATGQISQNVAGAAKGIAHVLSTLDEVTLAAAETRTSAESVRGASQTVEQAVGNLRLEIEDFLKKVAV